MATAVPTWHISYMGAAHTQYTGTHTHKHDRQHFVIDSMRTDAVRYAPKRQIKVQYVNGVLSYPCMPL